MATGGFADAPVTAWLYLVGKGDDPDTLLPDFAKIDFVRSWFDAHVIYGGGNPSCVPPTGCRFIGSVDEIEIGHLR